MSLVANEFDRSDIFNEGGIKNNLENNWIILLHKQVLVFVILLFWIKLKNILKTFFVYFISNYCVQAQSFSDLWRNTAHIFPEGLFIFEIFSKYEKYMYQ